MLDKEKCFLFVDIEEWCCTRCSHTWPPRLNTGELSLKAVEEYRDGDDERHEAFPLKCPECNSPYWCEPRRNAETVSIVVMVNVKKFRCMRPNCENIWMPARPDRVPKKCPKCKSPSWRRSRRKGTKKESS